MTGDLLHRRPRGTPIGLATAAGFLRSLLTYRLVPLKTRRLAGLFQDFVGAGDLCFDLGAHLGDRTTALVRLEASVVAVEPQPLFADFLAWHFRRERRVTVVRAAVAAAPGAARLHLSSRTPTVSSLSPGWMARVRSGKRFDGVVWDRQVTVEVTTFDLLIARFGVPAFAKIDVEGSEADVLRGLSQPVAALSFEYVPSVLAEVEACLERLEELGEYEYNWTEREVPRLRSPRWLDAADIVGVLSGRSGAAHSGDVYARRVR